MKKCTIVVEMELAEDGKYIINEIMTGCIAEYVEELVKRMVYENKIKVSVTRTLTGFEDEREAEAEIAPDAG